MGERERSLIYEMSKVNRRTLELDSAVRGIDQVLTEGETPRAAAYGKFEKGRLGLLVATDSRLIGFDKGLLNRTVNVREIPYDMIKAVSHKVGWLSGTITVSTFPNGYLSIETVQGKGYKEVVLAFASWVRGRIGATGGATEMGRGERTTVASLGRATQSPADELAKLASLRDSGVLTENEFDDAKKRLLNR